MSKACTCKTLVRKTKGREHVGEIDEDDRIITISIFNKKFWEELIAYFPFTTISISGMISRKIL
jgi:hypothetical protein